MALINWRCYSLLLHQHRKERLYHQRYIKNRTKPLTASSSTPSVAVSAGVALTTGRILRTLRKWWDWLRARVGGDEAGKRNHTSEIFFFISTDLWMVGGSIINRLLCWCCVVPITVRCLWVVSFIAARRRVTEKWGDAFAWRLKLAIFPNFYGTAAVYVCGDFWNGFK